MGRLPVRIYITNDKVEVFAVYTVFILCIQVTGVCVVMYVSLLMIISSVRLLCPLGDLM